MKILLISILALPFLAGCAAPATDSATASKRHEDADYQIGSNLPKHNGSSVQTVSPEDAENMAGFAQTRAKSN
ncbi:hypothetical protein [Glaciimonas soli]|uniref:Lipoprotein n=1 Tax=Glaciimonas soli TaxID=2590999 RepID=A0A843YPD8_9BURK|nr:hypothetical protein [Glaciimonas soli]MQR00870.1 hypothetical protein [Glaciimonas soli]